MPQVDICYNATEIYHDGKTEQSREKDVVIDDELIARVRILLGTSSIGETIDSALREVERREARRQEIRALIEMDGLDLRDPAVMSKTWRCQERRERLHAIPDRQERLGPHVAPAGAGQALTHT